MAVSTLTRMCCSLKKKKIVKIQQLFQQRRNRQDEGGEKISEICLHFLGLWLTLNRTKIFK